MILVTFLAVSTLAVDIFLGQHISTVTVVDSG